MYAIHSIGKAVAVADTDIPEVVVTIDEYWLTFLISVALPAIVALVTNRWASSGLKSVVLLALAAVNGFLTSLIPTGGTFELKAAAIGLFVSFVTAVATHYGLLRPVGLTGRDGAIQTSVPAGIGSGKVG